MAELILYFTEEDEMALVEDALGRGCTLVPDLDYASPKYESFGTLEEYKRYRSRTRQFFILSDARVRSPLEMHRIEKHGKTVYFIYPTNGGPHIQFSSTGLFLKNGVQLIGPGSLGHYPSYKNTSNQMWEKAPAELIAMFKHFRKFLKNWAMRAIVGQSRVAVWLGPGAVKAVQNGAKLVGFESCTIEIGPKFKSVPAQKTSRSQA